MNIGLEVLRPQRRPVASMEAITSEYISCEQMFANTNRFCDYGDQLFTTFDNICSIGATARRYGSAEGMAVLDALVGRELGGHVSVEDLKETAKKVWAKIKNFFITIWNWIKMFFQRIISLFVKTEDRLKKLEVALQQAIKANLPINEWRYIGLPNTVGQKVTVSKNPKDVGRVKLNVLFDAFSSKVDSAATEEDAVKVYDDSMDPKIKAAAYSNSTMIRSLQDSLAVVQGTMNALSSVKELQGSVTGKYNEAKTKVKQLSSKDDESGLKAAKLVQKKMSLKVKWLNKIMSLVTRSAMSILANCKVAKSNARLDKPEDERKKKQQA